MIFFIISQTIRPFLLFRPCNHPAINYPSDSDTLLFRVICSAMAILAFRKHFSLIPLLGLSTCLYLLTGIEAGNWKWFFIWFGIGLVIYLLYGYRKSRLRAGL